MNSKLLGYALAIIGLIGLAVSSEKIQQSIPFLKDTPAKYVLIPAIAILVVGIVLLISLKETSKQIKKEVPIYKGKEIIGYRVVE